MHPVIKSSVALVWASIFLITSVPIQSNGNLLSRLSVSAEPHIINGKLAKIEDVPYQIAIEKMTLMSCGGVIISDSWALTAAHCVHPETSGTRTKRIRVGTSTEVPLIGWGGQIHQIEQAIIHQHFILKFLDYDLAALKVSEKFNFGPKVQPITIPSEGPSFIDYKSTATISGWGKTKVGAWLAAFRLRTAEINIMDREACLDHPSMARYYLTRRVICGINTEGGSDSYFGDSGGPMVQKGKLIGLVSWGIRDIDANAPSVYSNILHESLREFITNQTGI